MERGKEREEEKGEGVRGIIIRGRKGREEEVEEEQRKMRRKSRRERRRD